jgi:hypothetical protein
VGLNVVAQPVQEVLVDQEEVEEQEERQDLEVQEVTQ